MGKLNGNLLGYGYSVNRCFGCISNLWQFDMSGKFGCPILGNKTSQIWGMYDDISLECNGETDNKT